MGAKITFSAIDVVPQNKKLEKDADGYYKVTIGAFNCFNSAGEFYLLDGVKELIENTSGAFIRRIKSGYLKGEAGHPVFIPGMTPGQYYARNMRIEITNVSHHIKEVMLTPTSTPSGMSGKGNIVLLEAWVRPAGPHASALEKDLEDPNCNVAFSIRCITNNQMIGGINTKAVDTIITWDWVIEPGIKLANKFDKLNNTSGVSMECRDMFNIDLEALLTSGSLPTELTQAMFACEDADYVREVTEDLCRKYKRTSNLAHLRKW